METGKSVRALAGRVPPQGKPVLSLHAAGSERGVLVGLRLERSARGSSSKKNGSGDDSSEEAKREAKSERVADKGWVWYNAGFQESGGVEEVEADDRGVSIGAAGNSAEEGIPAVPEDTGEADAKEIAHILQGVSPLAEALETDELVNGTGESVLGPEAEVSSRFLGANGSSKPGAGTMGKGSKVTSDTAHEKCKLDRAAKSADDGAAEPNAIGAAEQPGLDTAVHEELVEETPAEAKPAEGSRRTGQSGSFTGQSGLCNEDLADMEWTHGPSYAELNSEDGRRDSAWDREMADIDASMYTELPPKDDEQPVRGASRNAAVGGVTRGGKQEGAREMPIPAGGASAGENKSGLVKPSAARAGTVGRLMVGVTKKGAEGARGSGIGRFRSTAKATEGGASVGGTRPVSGKEAAEAGSVAGRGKPGPVKKTAGTEAAAEDKKGPGGTQGGGKGVGKPPKGAERGPSASGGNGPVWKA
ncbi:hypothetical protein KFL_006450010 [Klebsormidium nitens]|uniref:Uncharacterized protein n=1 Tax=Klebsormidium nitens TaxID=105231 RepID=A0A1Y1IHX3_KLENI|nr:hypothetical protein KFL_006450010 [Klebsormidium nitens]|eukprot:GAQ90480.1 hypothetical protein KFL_006450010 [Klebsormidium nitens]